MISKSPTFCPCPWTGLNIDQTGRVSPCMFTYTPTGNIKMNTIQEIVSGEPLREIKQSMANGEWHPACNLCKISEDTTGVSARTQRLIDDEILANINNDIDWFEPHHLTINWSNLCNLSCVYCNESTSTSWQAIKKIPIDFVRNNHPDLVQLAKDHGHAVQGLTLGGGEPLLQKGLTEFLQLLDPNKVRVMVTTNLSVDLTNNPVYQELSKWPNVEWQVSFDNADKDRFEYVRNGASWEQFEINLRTLIKDKQHVNAHPAYSLYCAFDLISYYEYCIANGLRIFWCDLTHPWDLDVRRLKKTLRNQAIEEIDRVIDRFGHLHGYAVDTLERYRKQLVDPSYLAKVNSKYSDPLTFSHQIEEQLGKTKTFKQLWPELYEQIRKYQYVA